MPKVIILGGGIAGMSAAHELAERGFQVEVYEMKHLPGGKARSIPVPGTGINGRKDLPGEHGFRFFPKFYKHIPDTLKRIPYKNNKNGVYDNLVEGTRLGLARYGMDPVELCTEFPFSLSDIRTMIISIFDNNLGLTEHDVEQYVSKLWQVMTSCDERRFLDFQRIGWWNFIQADKQSEAYRKVFTGLTRILVAAKSREANAYTIGAVCGQIMVDMITPGSADRLLNGPTNEVWLEPWLRHLVNMGVEYHMQTKALSIECIDGVIQGVWIELDGQPVRVTGDYYIAAVPVEVMAGLLNEDLCNADPLLGRLPELAESVDWMNGIQFFLNEDAPIIHGHMIYMDTPWALTSVSQKQFWPNSNLSDYGDGLVQGVLSVDISDWSTEGVIYGKKAMDCSPEQIKEEVWEQLKRSLNRDGEIVLRDEQVHSWFLDDDIHYPNPEGACSNMEPLLVNKIHTWDLRPNAYTQIPNFFLAADYVRTNTDLATMEGANEAARRAVNCILEASGSKEDPCKVWEMYEQTMLALWRKHDRERFQQGLPWNGALA
ncbi:phytoene dehydrogenase [Paenibacillus swuensis]|uniref:Phytoene dehydrogenase n=1 Tax=Paenibacillus swuensis TaxID=1178515 RepID=A0A172TMC6_9BACL|nr:FAD-dependent oxidoreductase [Paenibacillus swuensis]ANE48142.1 phytoene dehydrogenase [Paenibacillus swuensis]